MQGNKNFACCFSFNVPKAWYYVKKNDILVNLLSRAYRVSLCATYLYVGLIAAANGVVIATEKKLPSILVDETSVSIFYWHIDEF